MGAVHAIIGARGPVELGPQGDPAQLLQELLGWQAIALCCPLPVATAAPTAHACRALAAPSVAVRSCPIRLHALPFRILPHAAACTAAAAVLSQPQALLCSPPQSGQGAMQPAVVAAGWRLWVVAQRSLHEVLLLHL